MPLDRIVNIQFLPYVKEEMCLVHSVVSMQRKDLVSHAVGRA
jgi:hypothetical protein